MTSDMGHGNARASAYTPTPTPFGSFPGVRPVRVRMSPIFNYACVISSVYGPVNLKRQPSTSTGYTPRLRAPPIGNPD